MLKKTITFNDLDGNPVTEDFYFNLNKAELAEMQLSEKGGLAAHLQRVIEATEDGEGALIVSTFKDVIIRAVGRRSEDGRRFIKNQDVIDDFLQTEAYSEMFMEICTNADAATEFIKAVLPAGFADELDAQAKIEDVQLPNDGTNPPAIIGLVPGQEATMTREEQYNKKFEDPAWIPNSADLRNMTPDQISRAFARKQASTPE
jgi:hypothetical protein